MHVLSSERLDLRWFSADDAAFILVLLNEPSWIQNIGDRGVRTLEDARGFIEGRLAGGYRRGFGFWAVERREDHVLMGMGGLIQRDTLPDVDVGYAFLPRFWGQGYGREVAAACLAYGQRVMGLDRILAIVNAENVRSHNVLKAVGMRFWETRLLPGDDTPLHVFDWGRAPGAPRPGDDRAQIDALAQRFFAVFTNRHGARQAVAALPWFFLPEAVITRGGADGLTVSDVAGFMAPRAELLTSGRLTDFAEHEIEARTEVFGQIAQRWCRYRKAGTLDGQPFEGEGVKTMQLVRTAAGWRIAALAWEDGGEAVPLAQR